MQSFNLKIDGKDVSPESVELGDLLDTLGSMRTAIIASAVDAGKSRDSVFLSLKNIEKKCNLLTLCENEDARVGRAKVAAAIRLRDLSLVPQQAQRELRKLWSKASARSWTIALQNCDTEALIDPKAGVPQEKYLKGASTLFAYIVRVGGADPTAQVKMPNGEKLTLSIADATVAEQLGERLYQHAVLHGVAKWFRGTQRLAHFKVTSVGRYTSKKANPAEAMSSLSRIMGHHWENVDADDYLHEERSDDE